MRIDANNRLNNIEEVTEDEWEDFRSSFEKNL